MDSLIVVVAVVVVDVVVDVVVVVVVVVVVDVVDVTVVAIVVVTWKARSALKSSKRGEKSRRRNDDVEAAAGACRMHDFIDVDAVIVHHVFLGLVCSPSSSVDCVLFAGDAGAGAGAAMAADGAVAAAGTDVLQPVVIKETHRHTVTHHFGEGLQPSYVSALYEWLGADTMKKQYDEVINGKLERQGDARVGGLVHGATATRYLARCRLPVALLGMTARRCL